MKIRFDQNLSFYVVRAIIAALPQHREYEVTHVGDEHPPGTSDPDWLRKFASEGGTAIVSGDFNMLRNAPDLVAYTETGLISFFPPTAFEKLDRFAKIGFLVRWWPHIIDKIKISERGDRWRLPMKWEGSHAEMKVLRDPRVQGRSVLTQPDDKVVKLIRAKKAD